MMVRIVLKSTGVQVVREANYWNEPTDATMWHGQLVATKRPTDGIWRLYSNKSVTDEWPVASVMESAAFNALPSIEAP